MPAIDLTPAFAAEDDAAGLYVDAGGHFSARGAEVAAREIAAALAPLLE